MIAAHRVLDPRIPNQVSPGLCALAVMTKAPQAGKVKTRLVPPLTPDEAAALNICFLRDTIAAIAATQAAGGAYGLGCYTPVGSEEAYQGILPDEFMLVPQRGSTFGERLACATEDILRAGFSSVCLIDSDSPTLPPEAYVQAVEALAKPGDRIVLGPSDDGGYYLIGIKKALRHIFEDVDWSTECVFEQTVQHAREKNLEVNLLPLWYDVDERATLRRLCRELLDDDYTAKGFAAPETRRYLIELIANKGREQI